MVVLGYIAKLKRGVGIDFGAYFLHDCLMNIFLILHSINRKVWMMHFIFFSRYQPKCATKFLFRELQVDSWWSLKLLDILGSNL